MTTDTATSLTDALLTPAVTHTQTATSTSTPTSGSASSSTPANPTTTLTPQELGVAAAAAVAQHLGLDPLLALAIAQQESDFNPTAVGDQGASFGLYQLHQGGELGSLTPAEAENPVTNAEVALSEVAQVAAANPDLSPGQIAALAQRPANPSAYAAAVNANYQQLAAGQGPAASLVAETAAALQGDQATLTGISWSSVWHDFLGALGLAAKPGGVLGALPGAVKSIGGDIGHAAAGAASSALSGLGPILLKIVFVAAGLVLIVMGVSRLFPGVSTGIEHTVGEASMAAAA